MNLPHPYCLAAALKRWPQRLRSWYVLAAQLPWLPEKWLARDGAAPIRRAFSRMAIDKLRFPDHVLEVYAAAAMRPGALTAMLNWYRAVVRYFDRIVFKHGGCVRVPVLIIWGEEDSALGIETLDGTDDYVGDLTIQRLPGVSHP